MKTLYKQKGGFIWLIVIVVLAIVLAVILKGGDKATDTTSDTDSLASTSELVNDSDTTSAAANTTASPKPAATTKPVATKPAAPKMTASGAYIVYYTSSGFSPASLSLVRGTSVHFVNNSSDALRVAPVDTRNKPYAEFSQSKSVGYGGTFDYTFTSAGSYSYYNENNKAHQALISVQ